MSGVSEYPAGHRKMGEMGEMGGNGKVLQTHHGKCSSKKEKWRENGVDVGGKWVKNGTWSGNLCILPGPIFPIFPKGHRFSDRAVNQKVGIQVSGGEMGKF